MVTIMLDKERHLLLDINAMVKFEEITGKRLFVEGELKAKDLTAADFRALIWVMLIHEDKDFTLEQAGSLITIDNMPQLVSALEELGGKGKDGTRPL